MEPGANWAYEFAAAAPLDGLCDALNRHGPWTWAPRESNVYGVHLETRPTIGLRFRIHDLARNAATPAQTFTALLQLEPGSVFTREAVDARFRALLAAAGAIEIRSIEPYD